LQDLGGGEVLGENDSGMRKDFLPEHGFEGLPQLCFPLENSTEALGEEVGVGGRMRGKILPWSNRDG